MPAAAITVENLAKSYLVGHRAERSGVHSYTALRDVLGREIGNAARKALDVVRGRQLLAGETVEEFWALRDVSFEVQEGEVLGIIGRNGAGKSTLLKILSRITEPTRGRVTLRGRVASLLEVGTGFHPELTGRENIFLNGAILGMSRAEIRKKFDEIVAFAEVERFLDTPVKRYSSGMYVRLAFAVAAHLEPEILVVDEVLAVGDAEFQKKCLGKMGEVSRRDGRTVLFVSHNLDAVARICRRGILIDSGCLVFSGSAADAIEEYTRAATSAAETLDDFRDTRAASRPEFVSVRTTTAAGVPCSVFCQGQPLRIEIAVNLKDSLKRDFAVVLENRDTRPLFTTHLSDCAALQPIGGQLTLSVQIDEPAFRNGDYLVSLASFAPDFRSFYDTVLHLPLFTIAGDHGAFPSDRRWGDLYFPIKWQVERDHGAAKHEENTEVLRAARAG
jgi:lipopolysaccharide transport system ATP-binding protein